MHAQYRPVRFNGTISTKRNLLGNRAGHTPPAWRNHGVVPPPGPAGQNNVHPALNGKGKETGSKILLSKLPLDVGDKEVEELFKKTVGPLKDVFLIYNSQGNSKGMAVVTFQRPGDAVVARTKYDGKIVDGRRPLKIEIVYDGTPPQVAAAATPPAQPSLLQRLSRAAPTKHVVVSPTVNIPNTTQQPTNIELVTVAPPVPPRRIRQKKGPKRLKKRMAEYAPGQGQPRVASKEDLDKEMDDYRAEADSLSP